MCSSLGDNLICSPCLEWDTEMLMADDERRLLFFFLVSGNLSTKASIAVFEFWPGKGCRKRFKTRGRGVNLVLSSWAGLTWTDRSTSIFFFVSFLAWGACFDGGFFLKRGCFKKRSLSLRVFVCMGWKPLYFFFPPLCLASGVVLHTLRRGRVVNI